MMTVQIENLKFKYPRMSESVLDVPNFRVENKEKVFLYGPSGCGKTTLLEVLAGVIPADSGVVRVVGEDLVKCTAPQRDLIRANRLGYIFQNFNLIPYLSVLENITLPLYLSAKKREKVPKNVEVEQAQSLCQHLGIMDILNKNAAELSVGQQQRVAAARALLGQPELILADEPTSALDFDHREKFIQLLFSLCEKHEISVLFVSHDRTLQNMFDRSVNLTELNRGGQL